MMKSFHFNYDYFHQLYGAKQKRQAFSAWHFLLAWKIPL